MSLRELEIIFQMQCFKGSNVICIKALVLLFGKNCSEEKIVAVYMVPNLLTGVCF